MDTDLLIIGAGPFGMAVAAQAAHDRIDHLIVGKSMEFWRQNMPKGMFLRSACDWHLDPLNVHTIEAFLSTQGKSPSDVEPLSLDFYLSYADWFQEQKKIDPLPIYIEQLDSDENNHFQAKTADGDVINARRVVLAPGFKHFAHAPEELIARLPKDRFQHTSQFVDFSNAKDARYLIVGGRQSAYEWAALLLEAGAAAVHISHRHPSPSFEEAHWSWVNQIVDHIAEDPSWFRRLPQAEKDEVSHRLWAEGRLKLEPWLEPRLKSDRVKVHAQTQLISCAQTQNVESTTSLNKTDSQNRKGVMSSNAATRNTELTVVLSNEETVNVDQIVLATGYKVDIARLPILSKTLLTKLETRNGFPVLDDHFETSVPNFFMTSMPATQDFGPFFGFTISVRTSAKLICARLRESQD
jgi:cation diffusion facilitator CzcD-associated flavoprotein CzcO